MKLKPFKLIPGMIALGVIVSVCLARWLQPGFLERQELMTFDLRALGAARFAPPPVATNLGFVFMDEDSLKAVWNGSLGYRFGLYWPRQVYGRLVQELKGQGAKAVAFDIIMGELRPDHDPVKMADGSLLDSDEFFALQMRQASNVIIALTKEVTPPPLFLTNALAAGDITTEKDPDGVLRRVQVFRYYTNWHLAFRQAEAEFGFELDQAQIEPRQVVLRRGEEKLRLPLDRDGNFDLADFVGDKIPSGMAPRDKPFTRQRAWHMGVVLAAQELGLDLDKAEVDLEHGRIALRGPGGLERIVPVDAQGYAYVDWSLPPEEPRLTREAIQSLLQHHKMRLEGQSASLTNRWRGKLVVVGSSAIVGNNLTDRGATPLAKDTVLVSKHWNVANSIITGRFVQRSTLLVDLALILLLGLLAAVLTWGFRPLNALGLVLFLALAYIVLGVALYVQTRYWLPLFLPVFGALLMNYVCLVTWRVVFEQAERRRVKAVLSTIVSPKIATVLLQSEKLSLGGARREITVLFADVRGFTQFTDRSQEQVAEFVQKNQLSGAAAEDCFDQQARETLATINLYLGRVADTVLQQEGTLDKFIGDCVMAFWGAPNPEPRHAVVCVQAAIAAQRAIYELNRERAAENSRRELENLSRLAAGLLPKPLLPVLFLGTGINTGMATVGMMGSEVKTVVRQANYTVFGCEVNLASRLESASGRGRIFIGETTYQHLLRHAPALAATCVALPAQKLKGISTAVSVYEVAWRPSGAPPFEEEFPTAAAGDTAAFTSFVQRGSA